MAVLSGIEPSVRWRHVFVPLRDVTRTRGLPAQLFCDLLSAFEQDVVQHHYKDRPALLDYCRLSANPVGRLMLHLHGLNSTPHLDASDAICSALQLANFWQDLGVDTARGRLYIPETDCRRHGVRPQDLLRGDGGPHVPALVADVASWTRELMLSGTSLVHALPGRVGWELRLVVQGGLRILDKIQDLNFETLTQRPTLGPSDLPRMAWRAWRMRTPAVAAMTRTP
jgi:squalene synthase HpnC